MVQKAIQIEVLEVTTKNQYQLSATFYSPVSEMKGAILIVPAMAVTQNYYKSFAAWLAKQGYMVATFDYFGTGLSLSGHLRDTSVTITDWGSCDCVAMVEAIADRAAGKPVYWVGHSLGGQILGLVPNHNHITKAFTIACGSGYWSENVPSLKWKAWWLWFIVAPIAIKLYGYFPGKRLRKVGDLPKGVMNQWRLWCLHPEYMVGVEGDKIRKKYSSFKIPITSFSFTGDELMSEKNINSLHGFYTASQKTMSRLSPEDINVKHIGHFGFFKAKFEKSLWEDYLLPELQEV